MSETFVVWWIDDIPEEEADNDLLEQNDDRLSVEFLSPREAIRETDFDDENDPQLDDDPDLVLIDWKLHQDAEYTGTGTSMEGLVRDAYAAVPIYGFSLEPEAINETKFARVFDRDDLTKAAVAKDIANDIEDYRDLHAIATEGIEELIDQLKPPFDIENDLESVVPREFAEGLSGHPDGTAEGIRQFAEWVRDRFLSRPGMLYDSCWAATKLGLKEEVFLDKRNRLTEETNFENITYSGIFEPSGYDLWWKSLLIEALLALEIQADESGSFDASWRAGAELLGESEDDYAKCARCEDPFPETVAAVTPDGKADKPVHYGCSEIHHSREGPFADFRTVSELE